MRPQAKSIIASKKSRMGDLIILVEKSICTVYLITKYEDRTGRISP